MDVLQSIKTRFSTRAFLDKPIEKEIVTKILDHARMAPSAVNTQPWLVHVLTGEKKQKLCQAILHAHKSGISANPDYNYYPGKWHEPYKSRRKACGHALYSALDIKYEDVDKRQQAWNRNYLFFEAPVGLMIFIDSRLAKGSWIDIGMFIQTLMLAATHFGLHTCPQASMAEYPGIARNILDVEDDFHLVCGISLGYADMSKPVNQYRTDREPVSSFTTWHDE